MDANLEEKINSRINISTGNLIDKSFNLLKTHMGLFAAFLFLTLVISIVGSFIPFIGSVVVMAVQPFLILGFAIVADQIQHNEPVEFNDFFKAFKANYEQILITMVIIMGITMAAVIILVIIVVIMFGSVIGLSALADFDMTSMPAGFMAGIGLLYLVAMGIFIYLGMIWWFAYHFVYFKKLDAWLAMEASRRFVQGNFGTMFVIGLVFSILHFLTIFTLFFGLLITIPLSYVATYVIFNDYIGARDEEADGTQELLNHLLE